MKLKIISLILILTLVLSLSGCILKFGEGGEPPFGDLPDGDPNGGEENDLLPTPSGPVATTQDGYTFETHASDVVYEVHDVIGASAAIDEAIASHLVGLVLDFSPMGEDYNPATDFQSQSEFSSHVWLKYTYDEATPWILNVSIIYETTAASESSETLDGTSLMQLPSANDIVNRKSFSENERRAADFSDFPIDTGDRQSRVVYNSEELWWAVEHGYRPTFAIENSEAERIYNTAKDILRCIISKGMNDFEKALAIYEYLITHVAYDYDTYETLEAIPAASNACYYLEGVFEYGKAVCDGKSKAFVLLCGIEGISSVREFGYSLEGSGHAWNYVKIDGVWYCVDTTGGDAVKRADTSIAQFYGKELELINYKLFLAPLRTNSDKYAVGGVWKEITDTDTGASRVADVLVNRKSEALIESVSDFADMISVVLENGVYGFSLTVSIAPDLAAQYGTNLPHDLADAAAEMLGLKGRLERLIFHDNIDENKNYMYVFKLLPAEDAPAA